jgi:hypothetical protein
MTLIVGSGYARLERCPVTDSPAQKQPRIRFFRA